MIIIYSNEDYKSTVLKYCLLIKEMSFLIIKKKKSQRLNISSIEELHSSSLYDNQKTIEELNEKISIEKENNEDDNNNYINFINQEPTFNNNKNENLIISIEDLKNQMETIDQASLPSLTKIRKKAEYIFSYSQKNSEVLLSDKQPLIIEDLLIALHYLNDKLELPNLFPIDLHKKHMFFHVLKDINNEIILPYIEIENKLKDFLGLDTFVRMTNKSLSKKLIKSIYSELNVFEEFNKSFLKLVKLLNVRYNKKFLLFDYISIIDILILPMFWRLELIRYFDYYKYPEYKELFDKIKLLYDEKYCKKACYNKCNGQIVH